MFRAVVPAPGSGVVAVGLATIGLYRVVAYVVSRRTREIGIRIALGAKRVDVIRMTVAQGIRPAVLGELRIDGNWQLLRGTAMNRNTVLKDTAALRAGANLDFGDRVLVLLDRAPALMWLVAALLAAISAPLLLTIVMANPAIGVLAGLLAWAAHIRRPRQLASEEREADVLAGLGVLLFVGARLLAEVYLPVGIALGTCAVWLIRAALTERYMARHW